MRIHSEIKFKEIIKNLSFVKIIWNNKVIYDDYSYLGGDFTYNEDGETLEHLCEVRAIYGNKYIQNVSIKVVEGHHCILKVKGED